MLTQKPPPARQTSAILAVYYKSPNKRAVPELPQLEIKSWQELLEILSEKLPQKIKLVTCNFMYWGTLYRLEQSGNDVTITIGTSDQPTDTFDLTRKDFPGDSYEND